MQAFSQVEEHKWTSQRVVNLWLEIDVAGQEAVKCHNDQQREDR